jgi:hypothetical protein
VYRLRLLGVAEVSFLDKRRGVAHRQTYRLLAPLSAGGGPVQWATAERINAPPVTEPEAEAGWAPVPDEVPTARKLKSLEKALADHLYNEARLVLLENAKLGLVSQPGEDVVAFRERCRAAARQEADKAAAAERLKYQPKFEALGAKMPEGAEPEKHGPSVLNLVNPLWWLGFTAKEQRPTGKVERLQAEWFAKQAGIYEKWRQAGEGYEEMRLTPRRQDVQVTSFGLAWAPFWEVQAQPERVEVVAAYR